MDSLAEPKAELLLLIAGRVVPEVAELDSTELKHFMAIVDRALMDRPVELRKQFGSFLGVIRWAPLLRYGMPFDRLNPERQDAVLGWLEDCPVGLLRKGFWGLKSIVFMGYYGRSAAWQEIGYAPSFDSAERLRA